MINIATTDNAHSTQRHKKKILTIFAYIKVSFMHVTMYTRTANTYLCGQVLGWLHYSVAKIRAQDYLL